MTKKRSLKNSLKAGRQFPPAMSTKELVGRVFTVEEIREVNTEHGPRNIGSITLDGTGERTDAWLNGAILSRQLEGLQEDELLPATVKLTRDPSARDAYVIEEPEVGESFEAELATQKA